MIEFEVKAPVPPDADARVRATLGAPARVIRQVDTYYAHPARDFAATDEALRVRVVDDEAEVTYKGPKLEAASKAREEVTTGVTDADAFAAVLTALGFRAVATVRKTRRVFEHAGFEAVLDEVDGLDHAFLELERQLADDEDRGRARDDAARVLKALGLDATERRSYLELLLEKTNNASG